MLHKERERQREGETVKYDIILNGTTSNEDKGIASTTISIETYPSP